MTVTTPSVEEFSHLDAEMSHKTVMFSPASGMKCWRRTFPANQRHIYICWCPRVCRRFNNTSSYHVMGVDIDLVSQQPIAFMQVKRKKPGGITQLSGHDQKKARFRIRRLFNLHINQHIQILSLVTILNMQPIHQLIPNQCSTFVTTDRLRRPTSTLTLL